MTDDELLIRSLKTIQAQIQEERAELTQTDELSLEIAEEYDDYAELLAEIVPKISGVESLYELEDDEFELILECLETYQEIFVVDGRTEEALKATEAEYSQLADILFEFYDDENDEEEDEDDSEDENSSEED